MSTIDERQDQFIRLYTANGPAIRGSVRSLVPTREDADDMEEQRKALEICLEPLPARCRELLVRAYAPAVRINALAARIGRTPMSVYKELHRIRAALVDCTRRVLAEGGV